MSCELTEEGIVCQSCGVALENKDFPDTNPGFMRWCKPCAPSNLTEEQKCLIDGGFLNGYWESGTSS